MKAVVDTNVIAYYLLGTEPFRGECSRFWRAVREPLAPASWEAEIANVLWRSVSAGVLDLAASLGKLEQASKLPIRSVATSSLWSAALIQACNTNTATYDTLFVELAHREGVPLATFDKALLRKFPDVAMGPAAVVRATNA